MSLESKIENQTIAISALTIVIEALTAQMAGANITPIMSEGAAHAAIAIETVTDEVLVEGAEANSEDKETAARINAEAEKKALAKSKREAKKAEAEKKAQEEQNQADATAQSEEEQDQADAKVEVTADDLKAACLTAARAEEGNKVKVKALLAKYDATVVKDVAPANRAEILAKLESGDF